uniref:Nudix hydrolase domain-containing protein n=2 Tax=Aegilops tauschii TaxID=37682 RepID=A0A453PIB5_AEGTS
NNSIGPSRSPPINTPDAQLHGRKPTAATPASTHPSISHLLLLATKREHLAYSELKIRTMAVLVARQGRELQRYSASTGGRIVVGCIPYRVRGGGGECEGELEVLVISSQKGHGMMFPKGGWELDESMDDAARREALEEAGVRGEMGKVLGCWHYQSRRYQTTYEGIMYPLRVTDELQQWPEMASRKRTWATVQQVMEGCQHCWMREALEELVARHAKPQSAL